MLTATGDIGASRNNSPSPRPVSPWERKTGDKTSNDENPFSDPQNPFADPEKAVAAPVHFATTTEPPSAPAPAPVPTPTASAAAAVDAIPMQMSEAAAPQPDVPAQAGQTAQTDLHGAVVPVAGSASVPGVVPAPAQVAAPEPSVGNVYRVAMDFKPSMEDELELTVGQLVRMLHEYDDGWVRSS